MWEVGNEVVVVVRWWEGDGKTSEKNERWPEVKLTMVLVTRGCLVDGQLDEHMLDHKLWSEQRG